MWGFSRVFRGAGGLGLPLRKSEPGRSIGASHAVQRFVALGSAAYWPLHSLTTVTNWDCCNCSSATYASESSHAHGLISTPLSRASRVITNDPTLCNYPPRLGGEHRSRFNVNVWLSTQLSAVRFGVVAIVVGGRMVSVPSTALGFVCLGLVNRNTTTAHHRQYDCCRDRYTPFHGFPFPYCPLGAPYC